MSYLIDTNVFLRLDPKKDPDRQKIPALLRELRSRNENLYYTTQALAEFWTGCKRVFDTTAAMASRLA